MNTDFAEFAADLECRVAPALEAAGFRYFEDTSPLPVTEPTDGGTETRETIVYAVWGEHDADKLLALVEPLLPEDCTATVEDGMALHVCEDGSKTYDATTEIWIDRYTVSAA